jgi:GLPGLI family protein
MQKIVLAAAGLLFTVATMAQQKEGKVIYQRTVQMQITIAGMPGMENQLPRTRTDKFELNFANNQMSWKQMEDDIQSSAAEEATGGGGLVIRTIGGGTDDVTYCDFEKAKKWQVQELFDKKFLITDSIRRGNWKLGEETKTILNHLCRKATTQRYGKRSNMTMQDGKMVRTEVDDTSAVVAWFTMDIPVPASPEMQGQLPGMVLELDINNGRNKYTAIEITAKPNLSAIKEPTKGKKVTQDEFVKERSKMMEEMQRNMQGGNGTFQIRAN